MPNQKIEKHSRIVIEFSMLGSAEFSLSTENISAAQMFAASAVLQEQAREAFAAAKIVQGERKSEPAPRILVPRHD